MNYKSYLFKIKGPNNNGKTANKHCLDDETAIELAKKMVAEYPLDTTIEILRVDEIEGMEHKQWIGRVEHVVRRTI